MRVEKITIEITHSLEEGLCQGHLDRIQELIMNEFDWLVNVY